MKKVKDIIYRLYHVRGLKYIVVALIAVVFIGFVDENSVLRHISNSRRISELNDEIASYNRLHKNNETQIERLDSDPKSIEKIARERYFMKTDDEDIFVLSDDDPSQTSILSDDAAE